MNPINWRNWNKSIYRESFIIFIGTSLLVAGSFFYFLMYAFVTGLDTSTRATILIEARQFIDSYQEDPGTPIPHYLNTRFFLDDLDSAPPLYRELIPYQQIDSGDFMEIIKREQKDGRNIMTILTVYHQEFGNNQKLYVVKELSNHLLTESEWGIYNDTQRNIALFAMSYVLATIVLLWLYNRRMAKAHQRLSEWVAGLSIDKVNQALPDFKYQEFTRVAYTLHKTMQNNAALIEREHQFLRHASHELRTPIAVTRTNMEILDCIGIEENISGPVERIRQSNHRMQQLVETLLWLSRKKEVNPESQPLMLSQEADNVIEDVSYLLEGKSVSVIRNYPEAETPCSVPATALRIVLTNLIRNAFQYTDEGHVSVQVLPDEMVFENEEYGEDEITSDESIGLGLMLVEKICNRMNWQLDITRKSNGLRVTLGLKS